MSGSTGHTIPASVSPGFVPGVETGTSVSIMDVPSRSPGSVLGGSGFPPNGVCVQVSAPNHATGTPQDFASTSSRESLSDPLAPGASPHPSAAPSASGPKRSPALPPFCRAALPPPSTTRSTSTTQQRHRPATEVSVQSGLKVTSSVAVTWSETVVEQSLLPGDGGTHSTPGESLAVVRRRLSHKQAGAESRSVEGTTGSTSGAAVAADPVGLRARRLSYKQAGAESRSVESTTGSNSGAAVGADPVVGVHARTLSTAAKRRRTEGSVEPGRCKLSSSGGSSSSVAARLAAQTLEPD
jgi:hypothetical protein